MARVYEVKVSDLRKTGLSPVRLPPCKCCGSVEVIYPFDPLGVVQMQDVGKRCIQVPCEAEGCFVWQVESKAQFENRRFRELVNRLEVKQ